jgi:hypothetical protein
LNVFRVNPNIESCCTATFFEMKWFQQVFS